jgi:AcrR family transcriptional regulator
VTVDDIAEAADVGRMTVFNHFQRKEDMFFDRDAEGRELLLAALAAKSPQLAPLEALRRLAHQLVQEQHPALAFSARSASFVVAVGASEALKARARAIRGNWKRHWRRHWRTARGGWHLMPMPSWRPACCWPAGVQPICKRISVTVSVLMKRRRRQFLARVEQAMRPCRQHWPARLTLEAAR